MTTDERKTWLAGLKAGDEVVVAGNARRLLRVSARTPSGRFRVGTAEFNPDGEERGAKGFSRCSIVPVTESDREAAEVDRLAGRLSYRGMEAWRPLGLAKLRRIAAILDEKETP